MPTPQYEPEFDYQRAMDEYKTGQKPILDAIMSNYTKPALPIDPEQEKRAKYAASLSDTFTSLADMVAHGAGARVNKRNTPTSTLQTNARIKALQDKYDNDLLRYQAIKTDAEMKDLNSYLSERRSAAGEERKYKAYQAKQEQEQAREEERIRQFNAKTAEQQRQFELNYKEKVAHNNAMENKKPTSSNKVTYSPAETVDIMAQANALPKDWLVQQGAMKITEKADPADFTRRRKIKTYTWDAKATPAIRKALVEKYNRENSGITAHDNYLKPRKPATTPVKTSSGSLY